MYKQLEVYRENATMTRNSTYILQLPESGLLSSLFLDIQAECTSNATLADANWRIIDFISKIEVIGNGATVIKSLTGKEVSYLFYKHQNKVPPHFWRQYGANTQMDYFPLLFGRYLWDLTYGLDLSKWDTVEVKITNTATATYYSVDFRVTVVLNWLRELPGGFAGYLRGEEWRTWATVQDAWTYLVLPTEFPIATLALRALPAVTGGISNTGFANLMYDIDFSLGGGTKKLFVGRLGNLTIQEYLQESGLVIASGQTYNNADQGVDVGVGRSFGWAAVGGSKGGAALGTFPTMLGDATDNTISFEAHDAGGPWEWIIRGMAWMNMACLWYSHDLSPDTLLDPKIVGDCLLNIHVRNAASAAAGTDAVVLERLVSG